MVLAFKKIVSLARKRTHNPLKATKILQELLPKFSVIVPEDGGRVEKLADVFAKSFVTPEIPGRAAPRLARDDAESQVNDCAESQARDDEEYNVEDDAENQIRDNAKIHINTGRLEMDIKSKSIQQYNSYVLEIGFGSGENILSLAKNNPDTGFIACEVFAGGVAKLLEDMQALEINNIRIWHDDALELIPRLPLNSLSLIYILHPDPWPKRRHHDRRLVRLENLQLLASKMLKGAKLLIITDHQEYAQHIARVIPAVADLFDLEFDDYPEIVKTKYRLKAEAKGIESKYFCLVRK